MRALFVTSSTSDVDSLVRAWDCWQPDKSTRVMFPHMGEPRDKEILTIAREMRPNIIFYIGANEGSGIPSMETFLRLREMAPSINLCCDAGDTPWYEPLKRYKKAGCFNLQVALDGYLNAPVDLVTVTPVDPTPYIQPIVWDRFIRCGFSGGVSSKERLAVFKASFPSRQAPKIVKRRPRNALPAWKPLYKKHPDIPPPVPVTQRDKIVWGLENMKDVITVRRRTSKAPYSDHVAFMQSCQIIINTSTSGTGDTHHIKGRVLEAGWAKCALLESEGSPIAEWLPEESYFIYRDANHARELIKSLTTEQVAKSAFALNEYVKEHYHPRQIYGKILERAGLVDHSV